jgi:hypothetical protein
MNEAQAGFALLGLAVSIMIVWAGGWDARGNLEEVDSASFGWIFPFLSALLTFIGLMAFVKVLYEAATR